MYKGSIYGSVVVDGDDRMLERTWLRALVLMLLGMGMFFLNAALLVLVLWLSVGNWRPYITELVLVAALMTIPTAYYAWNYSIAQHL